MKMTAEEYARRVKQVGPRSPLGSDCLWAFCVGGGICLLGEVLRGWYLGMGLEAQLAGTLTSCTLIVLSALLTTVGCSGCWAADRSVYNTPAGMQKLQFSGRADGAEYRTSAIIAQIPKKNSPERGIFSWRPAGVTP